MRAVAYSAASSTLLSGAFGGCGTGPAGQSAAPWTLHLGHFTWGFPCGVLFLGHNPPRHCRREISDTTPRTLRALYLGHFAFDAMLSCIPQTHCQRSALCRGGFGSAIFRDFPQFSASFPRLLFNLSTLRACWCPVCPLCRVVAP